MSDELKPCPFCGGSEIYAEEYEHHPGAMRWRVFCAGCMAGVDTGTRQSMWQAVQDWNRRAERTCRNLNPPSCRDFECSECGESSEFTPGFMPNYCPNCGARVIEEES